MTIRIIDVPPGEAPDHVRAAWVGLTLPLSKPAAASVRTCGVQTGPRNLLVAWIVEFLGGGKRERGYFVNAMTAIQILESHAPEAAAWWREHTPHLLRPGVDLLFNESVCTLEAEPAAG